MRFFIYSKNKISNNKYKKIELNHNKKDQSYLLQKYVYKYESFSFFSFLFLHWQTPVASRGIFLRWCRKKKSPTLKLLFNKDIVIQLH